MKPFEFILVIISIVIGLGLTEFAGMVAYLVGNYGQSTLHWPYLVLVFTGFVGCLNYYNTLYALRSRASWNNFQIMLVFTTGLIFYVIAKVAVPGENFNHDYAAFYHRLAPKLFTLQCLWIVMIMVEAYSLKKGRPRRWYVTMSVFILVIGSGIVIKSETYRDVLPYVLFVLQALNFTLNKVIVGEPQEKQCSVESA